MATLATASTQAACLDQCQCAFQKAVFALEQEAYRMSSARTHIVNRPRAGGLDNQTPTRDGIALAVLQLSQSKHQFQSQLCWVEVTSSAARSFHFAPKTLSPATSSTPTTFPGGQNSK
mmetsp:Transcript_29374/g.57224  ORF Transcript_29374/g.57224 Transcript_29374/m.57224 type:complete len:118 (+) Transcript_29374:121-474(+)